MTVFEKRFVFSLLLLFAIGLVSSPNVVAEPEIFTAGTYNTYLMFDDIDDPQGRGDEDFSPKSQDSLQAMAAVIKALNVDFLGVQEVENKAVLEAFVNEHLSGEGYQVAMDEHAHNSFQVGLISRFPVLTAKRYGDPDEGDLPFRWLRHRLAYFEVEVAPENVVHVFVVHMKARLDARSTQMRLDMVNALLEWQDNMGLDRNADRIFVMGDMNCGPGTPPYNVMIENGFADYTSEEPNPDYTHSSSGPEGQIDFIFGSAAATRAYIPQTARVGSVPSLATLESASDHLPVVATFLAGEVADAASAQAKIDALSPAASARVEAFENMDPPSVVMERIIEEQLKTTAGSSMSIAEVKAEALEMLGRNETPPIRTVLGVAMTEGDKILEWRTQFSLMDASGGLLVDERGNENIKPVPALVDVVRVTGRMTSYRGVMQFHPVTPIEILGRAMNPPVVLELPFEELVRNGEMYMGSRVAVRGVLIDKETPKPGTKFGMKPIGSPNSPLNIHLWIPKIAFQSRCAVGDQIRVEGLVSKYDDVYQIQATRPDDIMFLTK